LWKQQNTLKDVTNVVCNKRCGENTTSSVPLKKRKSNNRDTILQQSLKDNSLQQQDYIELP
ncbi:1908_t:CDS:1, partial [Rhizophagus irregularis]